MARPRITIVTPSYNQAQFLEATIDSVLSQNYPDLEFVVMDGGSTDGSVDIIRRYEKHLTHWVSAKDRGQTDAINRGLARATGSILNWINSDDRLKPGTLQAVAEMATRFPEAGAWVGACDLVDEHGGRIRTIAPKGLTRDEMAGWGSTGHFFQPSCFFSRAVWEAFGPLDESLWACFDLDYYLKVAERFAFQGTDQVWTEATIHRDAKTTAQVPRLRAERYLVQARHGFQTLAVDNIVAAEQVRVALQRMGGPLKFLLNLVFRARGVSARL